MTSKKMLKAINKQAVFEFYSAYIYLAMSAYFSENNLKGCANWMKVQAQEEITHGMKMYNYIHDRDGHIALDKIDAPADKWASPLKAFEDALAHERKVTANIDALVELASAEKDHASSAFLQWFVTEQIEEEASVKEIIDQIKTCEGSAQAMFLLDRELGQRVFTPPATA